ncbi:hypothetical protein PROFUN_10673 [Planoprotostelium fungivorum]|uniref:F-box domain-containing protein n=1 Tax=Planoprotostelium fungivorum TaxID=1890364 RepID=A0A2P6MUV7_9EUKA|nr:hypothetical protein PROFUN_10673 [Planoprotostelium fungivorum]
MSQPTKSSKKVWLVTGSNRGIGLGFVTHLSHRDDTVVFAAARDPDSAVELQKLSEGNADFHLLKISSENESEVAAAVEQIEQIAGHLDFVIANAGLGNGVLPTVTLSREEFDNHMNVNAWGTIVLFQKVHRLLIKKPQSVFVSISSDLGSNVAHRAIITAPGTGLSAYGMSKAVVNWTMSRIAVEHKSEGIIALSIHPGAVHTDMLRGGIKSQPKETQDFILGMSRTVEQSTADVLSVIDKATQEQNGKYLKDETVDQYGGRSSVEFHTSAAGKNYLEILKYCLDNAPRTRHNSTGNNYFPSSVLPGIKVDGFGLVGLPLHPVLTVNELKKTMVEKEGGNCWEWMEDEFWVENLEWIKLVQNSLVECQITKQLGQPVVESDLDVEVYKLVLEEPGSCFSLTDADDRMPYFGYLSVILPTHHTETNSNYGYQAYSWLRGCEVQAEPITNPAVPDPRVFRGDEDFVCAMERALNEWKADPNRKGVLIYGLNASLDRDLQAVMRHRQWNHRTEETCQDITRTRAARILSERCGVGLFFGQYLIGSNDDNYSIDGAFASCALTDHHELISKRYGHLQMFFYVNKDVEDLIIRYGQTSDYFDKFMSHTCLDIAERGSKEGMRELKDIPDDILAHIVTQYVPVADMDLIKMTSRRCRDVISQAAWNQAQNYVQRVLERSKSNLLFSWATLAHQPDLVRTFDSYESIIDHMPSIEDTFPIRSAVELIETWGWQKIGGKMTSYMSHMPTTLDIRLDDMKHMVQTLFRIPGAREIHDRFLHHLKSLFPRYIGRYPLEFVFSHCMLAGDYEGIETLWKSARTSYLTDLSWLPNSFLSLPLERQNELESLPLYHEILTDAREVIRGVIERKTLPDNWTIANRVMRCGTRECTWCRQALDFYLSPDRQEWFVKEKKPRRNHIVKYWHSRWAEKNLEKEKRCLAWIQEMLSGWIEKGEKRKMREEEQSDGQPEKQQKKEEE